jgi:chromosome segregation ATPase
MALETELEVLKSVVGKLDSSLEKISEVSNSIGKLLAVHDERLNSLEKVSDKRDREIDELHSRITTQTREIVEKLESMEKRIEERMKQAAVVSTQQHNDIKTEIQGDMKEMENRIHTLEKWKWYIMGAGAAIGYALSNVLPLIKH